MTLDLPPLETVDVEGPVVYRSWDGPADPTFVLVHGLGGSHLSWVQVGSGARGARTGARPRSARVRAIAPSRAQRPRLMGERRWLSPVPRRHHRGAGRSWRATRWGVWWRSWRRRSNPNAVAGAGAHLDGRSRLPRGGLPHPIVLGSFAAYDVPRLGEALVRARRAAVDPESFVRLGLRMLTVDPSSIPDDVITLHAELIRDLRADPRGAGRVPRGGAFDQHLRAEPVARRPRHEQRALSGARDPRPEGPIRAGRQRPGRARRPTRRGGAVCWRGVGHVPQMEAPARWLTEVADWYAAALR